LPAIDATLEEIENEVRTQLEPLFSEFYTGSEMYKAYYEYLEQLIERMNRSFDFFDLVRLAVRGDTPKTETALRTLFYLSEIELVGAGYVDMAILLLTAKGVDLHVEPDHKHGFTRHVASPEDLDSPSLTLYVKLDFLKMNRLPFFDKFIDRKLRNDIAHANFCIDDSGKFFQLTKKGRREVDIVQKMLSFHYYRTAIDNILAEQMRKTTPPPRSSAK
jgi:hypothetical protein